MLDVNKINVSGRKSSSDSRRERNVFTNHGEFSRETILVLSIS